MSAAKKTGNAVVWVIIAMLIIGLGGFGVTNFGGTVDSIGTVGKTPIPVNAYARELTAELRTIQARTGQQVPLQQAQLLGLTDQARGRVITNTALDNETARLGLSVGDQEVADQILLSGQFDGIDGNFDREAYRYSLRQNGLSEAEFEDQIRRETARAMLQGAIVSTVAAPETAVDTLFNFIGERRGYSYVTLSAADLAATITEPDEAAITAYYEANPADFTAPEAKQITYAWLTPDMLLDQVEIDETALQTLYDDRADQYIRPERRLVERLIYPSAVEAETAAARLESGEADFETLVADRGLSLADIDMGDVTEAELGAAGGEVFAMNEPGVVGPLDTDFGPALFRMNAVLEANTITFDDVRDELRAELGVDRAARLISDLLSDIDDRLAAGATIEDLANETDMVLGNIAYFTGQDADIAAYPAFRAAASAVQEGDFPEILELENGGIFALRLNEITAPRLRPLDEVREDVIAAWQAAETTAALTAKADDIAAAANSGAPLSDFGTVETAEPAERGAVAPLILSETVFALNAGETGVIADGDLVYVVTLDEILPPADDADTQDMLATLRTATADSIGRDVFVYFSQDLLNTAGLTLDQAAINAVHAQFP